MPRKPTLEDFFDKVMFEPNSGCWLWIGSLDAYGYGKFKRDGRWQKVHRWAYEQFVDPIPDFIDGQDDRGPCVLHQCDVRSCVNPDHLRVGTQAENLRDASLRGRWAPKVGETSPNAKLNNRDVIEIRRLAALGRSRAETSRIFGVSAGRISDIVNGKSWAHV